MPNIQRHMTLDAGSVAEAEMDSAGAGQDGDAFTVAANQVVRIRLLEFVNLSAGIARIRIRRDATVPPPANPVLDATDNIEGELSLPAAAGGVINLAETGGIVLCYGNISADALGTAFYVTVAQPAGAAAVSVTLRGDRLHQNLADTLD
jgi:hypothetical protein